MSWACLQLGSREHYAIPAALHAARRLDALVTDVWASRRAAVLMRRISPALACRRRDEIPDSFIYCRTVGRLYMDLKLRLRNVGGWSAIMERNAWFQNWASRELECLHSKVVFSFAYTARKPFQMAGQLGMRRILDQIDGAWRHEELCGELSAPYNSLEPEIDKAPKEYWQQWKEEIEMADAIIVNSEWSKKLVVESGVDPKKLVVIPLVCECPITKSKLQGEGGKNASSRKKRLKALFLGSVTLHKGVGQLFDAIRMMAKEPIDFIFAGPISVRVPDDIQAMPHVRFLGSVDRDRAGRLYEEADVFLFPTLSDGFGLTQLEALGHGLPVIASTHCAQVVEDRVNGLVLSEITPEAIAEAVMELVKDRDLLASLKSRAKVPDHFHPRHLVSTLLALEGENNT